jgi:diguanylate cyclase (GGDEF)-like protein
MKAGIRRRVPAAVGAGLLAAIWVRALAGFGGAGTADFFARWMHDAVIVFAGVTCIVNGVVERRRRLAWCSLGTGLLLVAVGDLIYSLAPDLDAVPVPSLSDPFWLALYPCEYVTLLALTRERVRTALVATRLDGLIAGLAVASVLASITMSTAIAGTGDFPFWEQVTDLAYPSADLVLLGAIVSAVALAGWQVDRAWVVLGGAIVAWEAADLLYLFGATGRPGDIADALVATGAIGMAGAAALRPRRAAATPGRTRGLFLPVGFGIAALAVVALGLPLDVNPVAMGLAVGSLALVLIRMFLALRENDRLLGVSRVEATTDALTGLNNRRRLELDLERVLDSDGNAGSHVLVLLDLNGFKSYNDSFGHGAGDSLLARIGVTLAEAVATLGAAYRMGGDEFCVLAPASVDVDDLCAVSAAALATHGNGFSITAAFGAVRLPEEAADTSGALQLADARMYRHKNAGRLPAANQSAGVLVAVLTERAPKLASHVRTVCTLACATAVELGLVGDDLEALRHAARLHDVGKMAIPESMLDKPGPLTETEWDLVRRHTLVGERILAAAPALEASARLVRASHERIDGRGYPDGLVGDAIPVGSRIIHVADAFDAMTSERSYARPLAAHEALAELRRCAGSQFDAAVVEAFARVITAASVAA